MLLLSNYRLQLYPGIVSKMEYTVSLTLGVRICVVCSTHGCKDLKAYCSGLCPYTSMSVYVCIFLRIHGAYGLIISPYIPYFMQCVFQLFRSGSHYYSGCQSCLLASEFQLVLFLTELSLNPLPHILFLKHTCLAHVTQC